MRAWANDSNQQEGAHPGFMKLLLLTLTLAFCTLAFAATPGGFDERSESLR